MNNVLKISIIRPGKQPIKTEGVALQIPSYDGLLGIRFGRQPLLSLLSPGVISITAENGQKTYFATSGGFAEVHNNVVSLLCDSIITTKEIPNTESEQVFYTKDISTMNDTEKRTYLIEMLRSKSEEN